MNKKPTSTLELVPEFPTNASENTARTPEILSDELYHSPNNQHCPLEDSFSEVVDRDSPALHPVETGDISFDSFELDHRLMKAVRNAKYSVPTKIQAAAIPLGLAKSDIIASAQTGTGKTAAFVLPILQQMLKEPTVRRGMRVVVLTPTRELAQQVYEVFVSLARYTDITSCAVYGGVKLDPQAAKLRRGCNIVVACPGRLLDHIQRGNTDFRKVDMLVLDEADRMLDMGFLPEIKTIIGFIPKQRQTMLFSATFANELNNLAESITSNPQRIAIDITAPAHTVDHSFYPCPKHLKTPMLISMLERTKTKSVLVFTRTKHRANRLFDNLTKAGIDSAVMHSNKSQNQRQKALDEFRSGKCNILIATDIASRGLDIDSISHVVNFDIPDTADTYIHRIGRTGRAERSGQAFTLISKDDMSDVWQIEKILGHAIERVVLDDFDYDAPAPDISTRPNVQRRPNPAPRSKASTANQGPVPATRQAASKKKYYKKMV